MVSFLVVVTLAGETIEREINFHKEVVARNYWRGIREGLMPDAQRRAVAKATMYKIKDERAVALLDRVSFA